MTTGQALTAVKKMKASDSCNDSEGDNDSTDIILAFINSDEEDKRPNATCSE